MRVLCGELAERMAEDSDLHNRRPKNLVVQYRRSDGAGRWGAGTERSKYVHALRQSHAAGSTPKVTSARRFVHEDTPA